MLVRETWERNEQINEDVSHYYQVELIKSQKVIVVLPVHGISKLSGLVGKHNLNIWKWKKNKPNQTKPNQNKTKQNKTKNKTKNKKKNQNQKKNKTLLKITWCI